MRESDGTLPMHLAFSPVLLDNHKPREIVKKGIQLQTKKCKVGQNGSLKLKTMCLRSNL